VEPETPPASGEVGVVLTVPSASLYLSTTDRDGRESIPFLTALFSASTITFTSGSNVLTMPHINDGSDRITDTYALLIVTATVEDLVPFLTGDVVTITYA
jgi:hypothetical protein